MEHAKMAQAHTHNMNQNDQIRQQPEQKDRNAIALKTAFGPDEEQQQRRKNEEWKQQGKKMCNNIAP